jgi:hypothetical protein
MAVLIMAKGRIAETERLHRRENLKGVQQRRPDGGHLVSLPGMAHPCKLPEWSKIKTI